MDCCSDGSGSGAVEEDDAPPVARRGGGAEDDSGDDASDGEPDAKTPPKAKSRKAGGAGAPSARAAKGAGAAATGRKKADAAPAASIFAAVAANKNIGGMVAAWLERYQVRRRGPVCAQVSLTATLVEGGSRGRQPLGLSEARVPLMAPHQHHSTHTTPLTK